MECADCGLAVSVEHSGRAGPSLGQCHFHGYYDCAQGRDGGRKSRGVDDSGSAYAPGARQSCVGLLQQRSNQGGEVQTADPAGGPAGDLAQQKDHGRISPSNAKILFRFVQVQDLPRATRDSISDHAAGVRSTTMKLSRPQLLLATLAMQLPLLAQAGLQRRDGLTPMLCNTDQRKLLFELSQLYTSHP